MLVPRAAAAPDWLRETTVFGVATGVVVPVDETWAL